MKAGEKLLPELRFLKFSDLWKTDRVEQLAKVIDCKHRTPPYVEDGIPVVSPGSIKWGEIDLITPSKRVTENEFYSLMDHCSPDIGDLIFSRNQSVGVASYLAKKEKFVLGQDTVLIQAKKIDSFYLYFRLQTYIVQSLIKRLSGGSTFSRINLKEIRRLKIKVTPSLSEQQKIASFLSTVDKKIEKLTHKKDLLEKYKKGVMQKIFSQEIRFKDENGKDYPDWENKRLGDISQKINSGSTPTGGAKVYKQEGSLFIRSQNVNGNKLMLEDVAYIDDKTHQKMKNSEVYGNDILLNITGASIGRSCVVPSTFTTGNVNQHVCIIRLEERYHPGFYQSFLSSWKGQKLVYQCQAGGGREGLNFQSIRSFKICTPKFKEQQKIANFLTIIDKKIEAVQTQLTQTQAFKKGLLQKMFV